jgi:hypothetical protein
VGMPGKGISGAVRIKVVSMAVQVGIQVRETSDLRIGEPVH